MGKDINRGSKNIREKNNTMQMGVQNLAWTQQHNKIQKILCVKVFHKVPGVGYSKSFSPVASSSTIATLLSTTLHMENQGWTSEMFDVEAAFLNAELETPMYLEWPKSMRELGFITKEEESASS